MGNRVPGPIGREASQCYIDPGTLIRSESVADRPVGIGASVSGLPLEERFSQVLWRTAGKLPGEVGQEFTQMLTPTTLAIMVGVLVVWAGSHAVGVGFFADVIMVLGGVALVGWQIYAVADDFYHFVTITYSARTEDDLDRAAEHLANFVAVVGVAVLLALLTKGARSGAAKAAVATAAARIAARAGMTTKHLQAFKAVAQQTQQIVLVRFTNPKSVRWIEKGFPAKPMSVKVKTSPRTGIVTTNRLDEINDVSKAGYYVTQADGHAYSVLGKKLELPANKDWTFEPGQVIDPKVKKPLVGDYDLMAVVDPSAPGRNIALATDGGVAVANRTNPAIERVRKLFNQMIGEERVMHGAHDSFGSLESAVSKAGDGVTVFKPNGDAILLESIDDLSRFYQSIGRQPITGSYN